MSVRGKLAALSAIASLGLLAPMVNAEQQEERIRHNVKTGRPQERTRNQIRRKDRSRKQFMLKGVRP